VVFVRLRPVGGIVASELSKRATNLKMVGLERGPFRNTNPDFLMDHFDEFRYAVQGRCSRMWLARRGLSAMTRRAARYGARARRVFTRQRSGRRGGPLERDGVALSGLLLPIPHASRAALRQGLSCLRTAPSRTGGSPMLTRAVLYQWDKTFGIAARRATSRRHSARRQPVRGAAFREYPQPPNKIAYGPTLFKQAADQLASRHSRTPTRTVRGSIPIPTGRCSRVQLLRVL